nr:MAG TPA: hypothetical protein [Caudoviricetes sp.]
MDRASAPSPPPSRRRRGGCFLLARMLGALAASAFPFTCGARTQPYVHNHRAALLVREEAARAARSSCTSTRTSR